MLSEVTMEPNHTAKTQKEEATMIRTTLHSIIALGVWGCLS
jgi:hypothetical protein